MIKEISGHIDALNTCITEMTEARKKSNQMKLVPKSKAYFRKVLPYLYTIRRHCDKLELLVEDELWPLPKYRELLFTK